MSKSYIAIDKWGDDYNGAAIYSLVDKTNGKRYIGQAKHLQQRLDAHRINLNRAIRDVDWETCSEGNKLLDAVRRGSRFKVEILHRIPELKASKNELRYWECYYHDKFGGYGNTYNTAYVNEPRWNLKEYDDVELYIEFDELDIIEKLRKVKNIQEYIKKAILKDIEMTSGQ